MKLSDIKLAPEQHWQTTQVNDTGLRMAGKDDVGIEMPNFDEPDPRPQIPAQVGFWKRLWRRAFGPRPPPKFFVAIRRPQNTAVEIAHIGRVRARDDPGAWIDMTVQFRFVPEGEK
jgi:hypothetical protein